MLKNFVLHDGDLNNKEVGQLHYDTGTKQFSMCIYRDTPSADLPLSLEIYADNGKYSLGHEDTLRWARARVCPPSRHNIREILAACGLQEYDEFGILMHTMGKCDKDELYLKPLSD